MDGIKYWPFGCCCLSSARHTHTSHTRSSFIAFQRPSLSVSFHYINFDIHLYIVTATYYENSEAADMRMVSRCVCGRPCVCIRSLLTKINAVCDAQLSFNMNDRTDRERERKRNLWTDLVFTFSVRFVRLRATVSWPFLPHVLASHI